MCRIRDARATSGKRASSLLDRLRGVVRGRSFPLPGASARSLRGRFGRRGLAVRERLESRVRIAHRRECEGFAMREPTLREASISHRRERSAMWNESLVRRSKISRYEKCISALRYQLAKSLFYIDDFFSLV